MSVITDLDERKLLRSVAIIGLKRGYEPTNRAQMRILAAIVIQHRIANGILTMLPRI